MNGLANVIIVHAHMYHLDAMCAKYTIKVHEIGYIKDALHQFLFNDIGYWIVSFALNSIFKLHVLQELETLKNNASHG